MSRMYAVRNTLKNAIYKMQSYSSAQEMRQILAACHLTAQNLKMYDETVNT